ncbi:amidohydrolase family protein [Vagococcus fluvialis]|uniref:amidohydrolase family protein n=1 Tax=Vagococcus fluvialis TaxID=2738 RepID=UPI001D0BDE3B|nr:amidohydrolase family protein [Vagococcus fluvialis]UDM71550.1 amidohydrolase family protein [Vagococcus fluvialis]UDM76411.1 amidohydrolase family protein [Vagococcus fluvialis]UDM83241.1 amidohydrolase family protein [Vagococcus fluvialis]
MKRQRLDNVSFEIIHKEDAFGLMQPIKELYSVVMDEHAIIESMTPMSLVDKSPFNGDIKDMKGQLATPTLKDMHNHLDKTYMTLGWRGTLPVGSLKERLAAEANELPLLAASTKDRASEMIDSMMHRGVNHIRTHVNIDPYIGLKNLEGVLEAVDNYKDKVTFEIIAFPQHGLLRDGMNQLMKDAMRNGATMVGGLDPGGIDNAVENSLYEVMNLATEFDADVDIHLHDRGHLGTYTYSTWLDLVEENNYQGRSAISHGFSLGDVTEAEQDELITRIVENDMSIMSTIPYGQKKAFPPIDKIRSAGGNVFLGCDGFFDSWSSYVSSDLLGKVNNFCQLTGKITEMGISETIDLVTRGVKVYQDDQTPWLKVGEKANIIFTESASTAELIARLPQKRTLLLNGHWVKPRIAS